MIFFRERCCDECASGLQQRVHKSDTQCLDRLLQWNDLSKGPVQKLELYGRIHPTGGTVLWRKWSITLFNVHWYFQGEISYELPLRSCNTMSTDVNDNGVAGLEYFNTVVVQPHRKLVTNQGRGYHVRCRYRIKEQTLTNDFNVRWDNWEYVLLPLLIALING